MVDINDAEVQRIKAINSLLKGIDKWRNELAQRVFDIDPWEARENNATPETIAESIKNDPLPVIEYLLDVIEGIV